MVSIPNGTRTVWYQPCHGAARLLLLLRVLRAVLFVRRLVSFKELERRSGGQGLSEYGSYRDRREKMFPLPCAGRNSGGIS